ncbi:MAG: hypothetical protein KIT25_01500 [Enhydrobacter sp.]|nr:MAG: hypothetical protein KIT25_01500 [Enhydrobacter sp.]
MTARRRIQPDRRESWTMVGTTVALSLAATGEAFAQAARGGDSGGGFLPGLIVTLLIVAGAAYFFRDRIRRQLEQDRARAAGIAATAAGRTQLHGQVAALRIVAIVLLVVAALVTIILLVKINNTSSWALRFDSRVHEQLGWWSMGTGLAWILALAAVVLWRVAARNLGRAVATRIAEIRARLVAIEHELERRADGTRADLRGEKQMLESELRQLGA